MNKSLGFLGLAKKSGRLIIGDDLVTSAAELKKARLIITAGDAGEYALKRAKNLSERTGIPHIILDATKDELGQAAGRGKVAIAAITDMGMAAAFVQRLNSETGKYCELEAELKSKAERFARRKKATEDRKSKLGKRRNDL